MASARFLPRRTARSAVASALSRSRDRMDVARAKQTTLCHVESAIFIAAAIALQYMWRIRWSWRHLEAFITMAVSAAVRAVIRHARQVRSPRSMRRRVSRLSTWINIVSRRTITCMKESHAIQPLLKRRIAVSDRSLAARAAPLRAFMVSTSSSRWEAYAKYIPRFYSQQISESARPLY